MAGGYVEDESGKIHCVWFNQPYLAKMTTEGAMVRVEGKVSKRKKTEELYFSNPKPAKELPEREARETPNWVT